jgi:sec-independent protein translocase protein TatA
MASRRSNRSVLGLGIPELIVILVVALVIFGPGRLPDVGKFLGRSLRDFRDALEKRGEDDAAKPPAVEGDGDDDAAGGADPPPSR